MRNFVLSSNSFVQKQQICDNFSKGGGGVGGGGG